MKAESFCYWLMGMFELTEVKELNGKQTQQIKNHLNLVFKHEIDPSIDGNNLKLNQELGSIHNNGLSGLGLQPDGTVLIC